MQTRIVRSSALAVVLLVALFVFLLQPVHADACTFTSPVATGNWTTASWTRVGTACSAYPGETFAGDTVIIANGATITLDVSPANPIASLTVNGIFNVNGVANTTRTLSVTGDVTLNVGGIIQPNNQTGTNVHILNVGGNFSNNGAFTSTDTNDNINVIFNGNNALQIVGGSSTTSFNNVTVNKGITNANVLDIQSPITMATGGLTLTNGTFKLSSASTIMPFSGGPNLGTTIGLGINNAGAVVNIGNNPFTVSGGDYQLLAGTMNMGNGTNAFTVSSGTATMSGGTLNINGRFQAGGGTTTINGATINIDPQAASNLSASAHIFEAQGGANLTFTSGTVTIMDPHAATNTGNALQLVSGGTKNLAGSTFQFGNGVSATNGSVDGFDVNCGSGIALGNVIVNNPAGTNRHVRLVTNDCAFGGNLTITAGEFQLNGRNLTLAGNFTNNGTFTASTNTVTFNGSAAQTIGGSSTSTFNNLTMNNASDVSLTQNATVNGALALNAGNLIAGNGANQLTLGCNATVSSTGGGDVIGDVVRTCAFVIGTAYAFNNPNTSINFESGSTLPTSITINLVKTQPAELLIAVPRTYTITPTGGSNYSATVRLRYANGSELNGMNEIFLRLWRFNGTRYTLQGGTDQPDAINPYVWKSGVTAFSPWAISDNGSPTAVTLSSFEAGSVGDVKNPAIPIFAILSLSSLMAIGTALFRRR